jgi:isopentenyl-diphosphate delta-isomerase
LHLAFSSYLFDQQGRLLLTRRALAKKTWAGVWTNSCCGHPAPGEAMTEAVTRRIGQELGAGVRSLIPVLPDFRYRATDASGIVENEYCPVYAGSLDGELRCDPDEVMEHAWVPWASLKAMADDVPALLSPWAVLQIRQLDLDLPDRVLAR